MPLTTAALMIVRNEQHVVATCIGHLLTTIGVDRVYVVDNGSTDRTPDLLDRIARVTGRLVIDSDAGSYRQDEIVTALAHRAIADGADWLLPTDADEFLWLEPGRSLPDLCRRDDIGGFRIDLRNFVQARFVRRDQPGSLRSMIVAAIPAGSVTEGRARVTAGEIPFIRIRYPPKLLLRAAPSLGLTFGYHDATNTAGPLVPMMHGEILHAPMRAFEGLYKRAATGRRTQIVTPEPSQNWHLKRIVDMDAPTLEQEWRQNSYPLLHPVTRGKTRLDVRLARIGFRQTAFRREIEAA